MPFAVIETGGKQYIVSPKDKLKIEKLPGEAGSEIGFDKVLLVAGEGEPKLGTPYVSNSKVTAKVIQQGRARKIRIFKYKAKVRYRRRKGHRQDYTEVEIKAIS